MKEQNRILGFGSNFTVIQTLNVVKIIMPNGNIIPFSLEEWEQLPQTEILERVKNSL